jgi:hypothetical protein
MTRRLEELLDLPSSSEPLITPSEEPVQAPVINLTEQLEEFDKIAAALPKVTGLGDLSDGEFDALAAKAEQAYEDLMDLGMNVEARYGGKMFEVAASMMAQAIAAKSAKIDKKLKMVDLQLKKLAIDKKNSVKDEESLEGEGYILTDRNSILEKLKKLNK